MIAIFVFLLVFNLTSCDTSSSNNTPPSSSLTKALRDMEVGLLKGLVKSFRIQAQNDFLEIHEVLKPHLSFSHQEALKRALTSIKTDVLESLKEASASLAKEDLESCRASLQQVREKLDWRDRIVLEHLDAAERKLGEEILKELEKKLTDV